MLLGELGGGSTNPFEFYLFGELREEAATDAAGLKCLGYLQCPVCLATSNGHLARPAQNPLSSEHLERQHEQADPGAVNSNPSSLRAGAESTEEGACWTAALTVG